MTSEIVGMLVLNSDSYKMDYKFNQPLHLDQNRFNYFLNLLNVRFSNVVPNVTTSYSFAYTIEGTETTLNNLWAIGVYEIDTLLEIFNNAQSTFKATLSTNTGKITLSNLNTSQAVTITNYGLFSLPLLGSFVDTTFNAGESKVSPNVPIVSEYNYFILSSNSIKPMSFISSTSNNTLNPTSILYSFSSAINPFSYKDFFASGSNSICFRLSMEYLQQIDFQLQGSNGENLAIMPGSTTDFNICCSIVRYPK